MFRKLHTQMTLFFTLVISFSILLLVSLCLFISESSLKENASASFLKELNTMIIHLQSQSAISLQWQTQLQADSHFLIYFYDNGKPLYTQRFFSDDALDARMEEVRLYAEEVRHLRLDHASSSLLPVHCEFSYSDGSGDYYASVGTIPKNGGTLGFTLLFPLTTLSEQIITQRLQFVSLSVAAIAFLFVFCRYFTGRMLLPAEESHRKQIDFVSAASHELRAPLAVILSGTEALTKVSSKEEHAHFLALIQQELLRMQHLVSDLLLLARSDANRLPMHRQVFQPDLLLLDVYEQFSPLAHKKGLFLQLDLPKEQPPSCLCDPERLTQLFTILLDNALSYTPSGGSVTLSLSVSDIPARSLFLRKELCFCVSDTGPGIPDDCKERIFERFYRADTAHSDKQHFGLGLCLAKEIADAHHGKLRVSDSPSRGACFSFRLYV